jgi:hypothetical protein
MGDLFGVVADQVVLQQRHDDVGAAGGQAALARVRQCAALVVPEAVDAEGERAGRAVTQEHGFL